MNVTQLIAALQALEARGFGDCPVHVDQYNGGDDVPCTVTPIEPASHFDPVRLECKFVR